MSKLKATTKISNLKQNWDTTKYVLSEIEQKWQKIWDRKKIYSPNLNKAKKPFYNLMMFPYPSAEGMHVGNMYAFTGADVYGRFKRMQGFDVFEPIGLDGFGIHSENYAIKVGRHPKEQAKISEQNFYRQLRATGNGFDWSRKLETYDPKYYKWTQWLFIQLFKAGLGYRKKAPVNFCPSCKTVLADEQVVDGKCERCSSIVEKRDLEQWFFRITKYAERLLNNIEKLNWTEKVKVAQRNWIEKSEGLIINFGGIDVFTTRPETADGATFLVLSPQHPKAKEFKLKEVIDYIKISTNKTDEERRKEKTGVFTGEFVVNPLTKKKIPVWIADYVLMEYGTGAIMAVPAEDERDREFAEKYKIPINKASLSAKPEGKKVVNYHLRDWLISRQRYWGPPIPMIYCEACAKKGNSGFTLTKKSAFADGLVGQTDLLNDRLDNLRGNITQESRDVNSQFTKGVDMPGVEPGRPGLSSRSSKPAKPTPELVYRIDNELVNDWNSAGWFAVEEKDLPVLLPDVKDWKPLGTGTSPLANHPEFYKVKCPNCKSPAKRETDVSDTFLDSAWYFLRYVSTDIDSIAFDTERVKKWLPVKMYIGGAEHSVLHLLYSRFITMALADLGFIEFEEPFAKFRAHGLLVKDGAKMSKSKGNVVIPDQYIKKFGADTLRTYLMFMGPFSQGGDFRDTGIEGMHKFLKRIWRLINKHIGIMEDPSGKSFVGSNEAFIIMNRTIKKVTDDLSKLNYNTAIAALMEYYNFLAKQKVVLREELRMLTRLIAPFMPHMAEEIWEKLGENFSVHKEEWPKVSEAALISHEAIIAVQINGKLRDILKVTMRASKDQRIIERLARASDKVKKHLEEKSIKKVVYVEGKVINFVTD